MSNKSSSANRLFQILFLTLSKPILDLEKFLSPPEIFDPLIHHPLSLSPRIVILLCVCISQFFHSCVLIEKAFISPSDRYIISFELFLSPSYF